MTAPTHSVGTRSELMNRLTRTPRSWEMVGVHGALGETLSAKMKMSTPGGAARRSQELGRHDASSPSANFAETGTGTGSSCMFRRSLVEQGVQPGRS